MIFFIFYQVKKGVGFLYRTGAEIGYEVDKK